MKVKALLIAVPFIALACNNLHTEGEKNVTMGDDTLSKVNISVSKTGALEGLMDEMETADKELHFKATGTEPGWSLEIKGRKAKLVSDYGKDSILFENNFDNIGREAFVYTNTETIDGKTRNLALSVEQKNCTDAAGVVRPQTVTITFNGKTYTGCGSLVKD